MSKTLRWLFPACLLLAVAVGCLFTTRIYGGPATPPPNATDDPLVNINVVDLPKLVEAHPDAKKLAELDKEIAYLSSQSEALSDGGMKDATEQAYHELEKIHKQLTAAFEADMNRVKADLDRKKANVEATLKGEADRLKSEMESFQAGLKGQAMAPPATADVTKKFDAKMSSYVKDLIVVRDSNYAARRLQIQRRMDANLADEKKKMEAKLAQRMEDVMRANQHERLQLQLDIQTATNEEQRKKLQERMNSITSQEEDKRDAIRKELSRSYEVARQQEMARGDAELKQYAAKLNADMNRQLGRAKADVIRDVSGGYTAPDAKKLTAEAESKLRELKSRFEARKNELVSGLRQDSASAQAYLQQRQKQLQSELDDAKKRILKQVDKTNEKVSADEKKRQEHVRAELESLKQQREKVYDGIVDQIRQSVADLAREQKVPLVVGGYRVNVSCKDLTELALQRVTKK